MQLGKDRTVVKNRIHAVLAKNGVKHEFTDLFGVGGRNYFPHTDSASSSKVSRRAKEVLHEAEERERHKDSGGSDSEEAAQGDILLAEQKRKP
ncbi:MAG: hypothetical protein N2V75_12055 [Methanophagales archaeon]|nr:hypothetical protein [Methanophagales archaeon]